MCVFVPIKVIIVEFQSLILNRLGKKSIKWVVEVSFLQVERVFFK